MSAIRVLLAGESWISAGTHHKGWDFFTAVEEVLPVFIFPFDDRVEAPEGVMAELVRPDHPIVQGIAAPWLYLLGYNELTLRPEAELIAKVGDHLLPAVRQVGRGRTLIWASDIGPHWCPEAFVHWDGYRRLWRQAVHWPAAKDRPGRSG